MTSGGTGAHNFLLALAAAGLYALLPAHSRAQDTAGADPVLAFAEQLRAEGDYYRAITEYKRYAFLHPDATNIPQIELDIALCYLLGQRPEAGRTRLREIEAAHAGTPIARKAALLLAGSYHAAGDFSRAALELGRYMSTYPDADNLDQVRIMRGLCLLRSGETDAAVREFHSVDPTSTSHATASALEEEAALYNRLPRKSPLAAGILSAALPGAGQCYVGYYSDAAFAFILNGVLIWAAWESFDNGENVTGGLLAVIEFGWYTGNIYNAVNNAHKYNRRKQRKFFRDLELRYGLFAVPEGGGAALGVRF